jgi:hypothetical protein
MSPSAFGERTMNDLHGILDSGCSTAATAVENCVRAKVLGLWLPIANHLESLGLDAVLGDGLVRFKSLKVDEDGCVRHM